MVAYYYSAASWFVAVAGDGAGRCYWCPVVVVAVAAAAAAKAKWF